MAERLVFYTAEKLGPKQSLTPEGYLLCEEVPVARIGLQRYGADEVPVEADGDGIVYIQRDEDEVFRAETLASFMGKPVTIDHPSEDVTPANYTDHAAGVTMNPRRGTGLLKDFMVCDLLITVQNAIDFVRDGDIREVSAGYDAEYEKTEPGRGRQFNIIGNHVALVKRGRCGPSCAIGDSEMPQPKKTLAARFMDAFRSKDEKEMEKVLEDAEMEGQPDQGEKAVHIHLHQAASGELLRYKEAKDKKDAESEPEKKEEKLVEQPEKESEAKDDEGDGEVKECLRRIEALLEKLAGGASDKEEGEETESEKGESEKEGKDKARDSAYSQILARAEILAPGARLPKPTADAMRDPKKTRDALCIVKRAVLDGALRTQDSASVVEPFLQGKTVDKLGCAEVDAAFIGASEVMKRANNSSYRAQSTATSDAASNPFDRKALTTKFENFWSDKK